MQTISITAGRLICAPIRSELERLKFICDGEISFIESDGFFSRDFHIKVSDRLYNPLMDWMREIYAQTNKR